MNSITSLISHIKLYLQHIFSRHTKECAIILDFESIKEDCIKWFQCNERFSLIDTFERYNLDREQQFIIFESIFKSRLQSLDLSQPNLPYDPNDFKPKKITTISTKTKYKDEYMPFKINIVHYIRNIRNKSNMNKTLGQEDDNFTKLDQLIAKCVKKAGHNLITNHTKIVRWHLNEYERLKSFNNYSIQIRPKNNAN